VLAAGALLAGLLLAAGCGDDDASSSPSDMSIEILTPPDGEATAGSFELAVDASVPLDEPDTGMHHLHVYYDGNTAEGEYDIVYGTTTMIDGLDPGEHTIEAAIANPDHSLTGTSDTITVDVGSGGAPAPEPTPPPIGYDY
jgi:hypothetical protein